jgi:diguanylate cyclase (GGDEF)-like protein
MIKAYAETLSPPTLPTFSRLGRLINRNELFCVFQPIADLQSGTVFAHEALIRGPSDSLFHTPDALLTLAREEGLMQAFEMHCIVTALTQWGAGQHSGRLFVNISANTLVNAWAQDGSPGMTELLRKHKIKPRLLVLELTEHERVLDMARLCDVAKDVHAIGIHLALDDFGDGRSSLRLWSEIKPDFVKIDKYFAQNISRNPEQLQVVRAIREIATLFGSALVAEGIETANDLRVLRDLDIRYGQGYFLGKPTATPLQIPLEQACTVLKDKRVAVMPQMQHSSHPCILRALTVAVAPTATPDTCNNEVADLFQINPELHALAFLNHGKPIALLNRQTFMNDYARLYFREVHGRRPAITQANLQPRIIERSCNINDLVGILTSQDQRYLTDGFIVTDNGRYIGLGTGDQLVRSVTEARIEAARHANPLTFLPGNIPITQHIKRLLDSHTFFVAAYADLNHFKPFNDQYGYWRGDEMIRLLAKVITQHCDPQRDFVGHVGGDDFIILFQSTDWQDRCQRILQSFNQQAIGLFDDAARQAGGIHAEDRQGVQRFFTFTTLSIGAVLVKPHAFQHAEQVANEAALAKHDAKQASFGLSIRVALSPQ